MRYRLSNGKQVHSYRACPNEAALQLHINVVNIGDLLIEAGYFVEELTQNQWVKMNPQPIYSSAKKPS